MTKVIETFLLPMTMALTLCSQVVHADNNNDLSSVCEKEQSLINNRDYLNKAKGVMKQPACLKLWEPKRTQLNLRGNLRGYPWKVYTTHEKVKFYRSTDHLLTKSKGASLSDECEYPPYVVKASYQDKKQKALYLAKANRLNSHEKIVSVDCGWVAINDLILDSIPIRNGYNIDYKGVIILDRSTKETKDHSLLYSNPNRHSSEIAKLPVESIAFIYKDLKQDKERWYYIVTDSSINDDRLGRATSGWIPASSVQRWDTSMAVYPNPDRRQNKAHICRDESAARNAVETQIVVRDKGLKVDRPVEERSYLVLPTRESRHRRRRKGCRNCIMVSYYSKAGIREGYIRLDSNFIQLTLMSKFDLSDYISTIAEIAEYGDKVSIIKALKKTCQQLSRSSNVTSSSCNNMRDAINNTGDYDLWRSLAEDILKKLKDKRFLNPILKKSQTILKKLFSINRNHELWFKIGDHEYIWVKQSEML